MEKPNETSLTVAKRARRHSKEEIAARMAEYRASGLTAEAFAAQTGLQPATLRTWQYRLQREQAPPSSSQAFARVQVRASRARTLTVRWPQGVEVEVAVDLDEAGVVRVVRDLLAPCWR